MLFMSTKKNNFSTYYPNLTHLFMRNYDILLKKSKRLICSFYFFYKTFCFFDVMMYTFNMKLKTILNETELQQAIELDRQAYSNKDLVGSLEKCKQWLQVCPDMYIALYENKKMVGYINFVPLTAKCFGKFKNGKMCDSQINARDILPFRKGENFCLLMSIVIRKEYQNTKAIILLTQALLDRIDNFAKRGIYIPQFLTECVSDDGKKFITRTFDSKKISNSKNGEIYLCSFQKKQ